MRERDLALSGAARHLYVLHRDWLIHIERTDAMAPEGSGKVKAVISRCRE